MHSDTRNEMQLRVLAGMWAYPELFRTVPQYLAGDQPWLTIRKALEAFLEGRVSGERLVVGMKHKYGQGYVVELSRVFENAKAVPCREWAETQVRVFTELLQRDYEREHGNAA